MKKILFTSCFLSAMFFAQPVHSGDFNISGEWLYGRDNTGVGGTMEIRNCDKHTCTIEFMTYNGAHTCELDDGILVIDGNTAHVNIKNEYMDKDCRISITMESDSVINVSDNNKCNELCGMSGIFTGQWQNKDFPATFLTGFDCAHAKTDVEKTICHNKNLAEYDREIGIIYKKSTGQKELQKKWLIARNKCGTDIDCLTNKYDSRLRELVSGLTNNDFSMFDYARLVSENGWFHPNEAILISNFIRDKVGDDEYATIMSCSNRRSNDVFNENEIFAGYGCPGLFTIMESAIYINKNQIWLSYLNDGKIKTYAPRNAAGKMMPLPLSDWIQDLKGRAKDSIKSEIILNKL